MTRPSTPPPHPILIAMGPGAFARVVEDLFASAEYAAVRVFNGRSALEQARTWRPNLIALDLTLPDMSGLEACRTLFVSRCVSPATPVLLVVADRPQFEQQLAALRVGARDLIGPWLEREELRLICEAHLESKEQADRFAGEGLVDPGTGLYNRQGLIRRAREMGAEAVRHHRSLACVVLTVDVGSETVERQTLAGMVRCAQGLRASGRLCDAIGRLGPSEFAVLAPATDAPGAARLCRRLAARIRETLAPHNQSERSLAIRAGYEAVANLAYTPIDPAVMILRATTAVRSGRAEAGADWIRRFEGNNS